MNCLRQLPAREVGQAAVADLACANEAVKVRSVSSSGVHGSKACTLVKINMVQSESGQRRVQGSRQMPGGQSERARLVAHREPALSR